MIDYIKYVDYNYLKGYKYERYVLEELKKIYKIKEGYLWKNIPDKLLIESGIIIENDLNKIKNKYQNINKSYRNYNVLLDTGIDIICKLENNTILLIQCKAYSSVISQKHLSGFFRIILDSYLINKREKKITGLIVHTSSISDIITTSYCYKYNIITSMYIPFEKKYRRPKNPLQKYKNINIIINFNLFMINIFIFLAIKYFYN